MLTNFNVSLNTIYPPSNRHSLFMETGSPEHIQVRLHIERTQESKECLSYH